MDNELLAEINENDVFAAATKADKNGKANAFIGLMLRYLDENGKEKSSEIIYKPLKLRILVNNGYYETDLIFSSGGDNDLIRTMRLMSNRDDMLSAVGDPEKMPLLSLVVIPKQYDGSIQIVFEEPLLYTLSAEKVREDVRTLKMIFEEDMVSIMFSDDVSSKKLARIVDEEEQAEIYAMEEEEREQERLVHENEIMRLMRRGKTEE